MLSESEKLILDSNRQANLALFGQEYNDESWAICCSDMLIKDEDTANIVLADTLGDGKTKDGFEGERFHYLMANPPFGEFGFLKVTVERPLRMNFEATPERIATLDEQTAFANLATSKKRKDAAAAAREIAEGGKQQEAIRAVLATLEGNGRYMDREAFEADAMKALKRTSLKVLGPIRNAIFAAVGERDPNAEICRDSPVHKSQRPNKINILSNETC